MARQTEDSVAGAVLSGAGIPFTVDRSSKHRKVRWQIGDQRFTYFCSATSSDWRGVLNARSDVRRMLRQAGIPA